MGFPDAHFDVVYASQTMEHWGECWGSHRNPPPTPQAGLAEIARVLRLRGIFFVDVPILSHGTDIFRTGNVEGIMGLFGGSVWENVTSGSWGMDCKPLIRNPRHNGEYVLAIRAARKSASVV